MRPRALIPAVLGLLLLLPGAEAATNPLPDDAEIYAIPVAGGAKKNLTRSPFRDDAPVVSPDGKRIAFVRGTKPEGDIWVMNADGSGQVQRTGADNEESDQTWSPDSKTLAFTYWEFDPRCNSSRRCPVIQSIGTLEPNSAGLRRNRAKHARFAPSGGSVAFQDLSESPGAVAVVRRDGSAYRALKRVTGAGPEWSRSGRLIAFESSGQIGVMRADGSAARMLGRGSGPVWSPRGLIAFVRDGDLFVVRPDGKGLRRLTRGLALDSAPIWSPSGLRLAFVRKAAGAPQIWVIGVGGRRLARVTREVAGVTGAAAAWSRDGKRLYYAALVPKL